MFGYRPVMLLESNRTSVRPSRHELAAGSPLSLYLFRFTSIALQCGQGGVTVGFDQGRYV